ncbi:MAG: PAS domain S-box protein, partial [Pedobacter sp.]
KMLANSMPQMCWTNDKYGEVDFYNERWYEYTGLTYKQAREMGWEAFLHPNDLEDTLKKYQESLQTGKIYMIENRYRAVDGTYRWYLSRGIPVRNDSGEIFMWVCTATDIDFQRKAMDKKDEFIGIASHELKTPLTSVKGYLQLITNYNKQELPAIIKQFIERANQSINKLQNLVNDLLDVSKIQAGKLEFKKENIKIWSLITACEDNAKMIYSDHEFVIDVRDDHMVFGNAERLEQVIMNFISNAVKYGGKNKRIILSVTEEGDEVFIAVRDFGIGLTDSEKAHVFDRFYRVEDKEFHTSGLGMGLFISKEIVKAHNGTIGLESKFGDGSTFYFGLAKVKG